MKEMENCETRPAETDSRVLGHSRSSGWWTLSSFAAEEMRN
jgi:hypothetical protein